MDWTEGKIKVLGTVVAPLVAIPSLVLTYLIYMALCPNPTDGTLLFSLFVAISGLAGFTGFAGGQIVSGIKARKMEQLRLEDCIKAEEEKAV